jgi:Domain of unknown function (DUF5668)
MSNGVWRRCSCPRCTIRSLMGPAVVITIGVLFLLQQMRDSDFGFGTTWPFLLIVIGVILLGSSIAPMTGHVDPMAAPPGTPPGPPGSPLPPASGQGH